MILSKSELLNNNELALAACIYFESRGETKECCKWVGHTVLNRVKDSRFPNTIAKVVFQPKQFSWTIGKSSFAIKEEQSWNRCQEIANEVLKETDITGNSLYFLSGKIMPSWAKKLKLVRKVDSMRFYRD